MQTFADYKDAFAHAQKTARAHNLDMVIRGCKEYGKQVFPVSYASKSGSDYARYEIVTPSTF